MKYIKSIIILIILIFSTPLYATNICEDEGGFLIGFFNGVTNTQTEAEDSLEQIQKLYQQEYSSKGLQFELFYNQTEGLYTDLEETGIMRIAEEDGIPKKLKESMEYIWYPEDFLRSNDPNLEPFNEHLKKYIDARKAANIKAYETLQDLSQTTRDDFKMHKSKIKEAIDKKQKLILVAHSQGNLFVNRAYDEAITLLKTQYPDSDPTLAIRAIHVAPASQTSRGPYLLSDSDQVISSLLSSTSYLTNSQVAKPNLKVPLSLSFPLKKVCSSAIPENYRCNCEIEDSFGHGFKEIYINKNLLKYCDPTKYDLPFHYFDLLMRDAFNTLRYPSNDTEGLVTVSLQNLGTGLFVLAIREPSSSTPLYYANPNGKYGTIHTDPNTGVKLQEYKVNCELTKVNGGIYDIGIAQYTGDLTDKVILTVKDYKGTTLFESRPFGMSALNTYQTALDPLHVMNIRLTFNHKKKTYEPSLERVLDNIRK